MKLIKVGIFWAVPNKYEGGWDFYEVAKSYELSAANSLGFIDYPYSHYDKWDDVRSAGDTPDCYYYPRGRVLYDVNQNKHRIFADECLDEYDLHEIVELFEIEDFQLRRDEHYVSAFTPKRKQAVNAPVLNYKVLRGQDKIGENLIEITYGDTQILVELGKSLDGSGEQLEQEVLSKKYSAVVVSHYHEDHAGLIRSKRDCPIYIGSGAYRVLKAMSDYLGCAKGESGEETSPNIKTYKSGRSFNVGGVQITPYLCDHSAYDSYMLLFKAGGKSILYTGDFRFHGRKNKDVLLSSLPKEVDVLIHEGTNNGKNACTMTEAELENKAVEIMQSTNGPVFVLQSATNIDRLVSIYRASKRSNRIMYMDNYASLVAFAAGGKIPRPDVFPNVIAFTPRLVRGRRKDMFFEIQNKRGLQGIAKGTNRYVMLVRPTMLNYILKLFATANYNSATLIYSIWQGYKQTEPTSEFLTAMRKLGVNIVDLHTSGHASAQDIELLVQSVKAKQTVCVHTEV